MPEPAAIFPPRSLGCVYHRIAPGNASQAKGLGRRSTVRRSGHGRDSISLLRRENTPQSTALLNPTAGLPTGARAPDLFWRRWMAHWLHSAAVVRCRIRHATVPKLLPSPVAALNRFARFDDPAAPKGPSPAPCTAEEVEGILLAREGINGTIAGSAEGMASVLDYICTLPGCADLDVKVSPRRHAVWPDESADQARDRHNGEPEIDPAASAGTDVRPQDWNALITDPDTIVIDTRQHLRGRPSALSPGRSIPRHASFREFPGWFRRERKRSRRHGPRAQGGDVLHRGYPLRDRPS